MKQTKQGIVFLILIFLPYNFSPNPQLYLKYSTIINKMKIKQK